MKWRAAEQLRGTPKDFFLIMDAGLLSFVAKEGLMKACGRGNTQEGERERERGERERERTKKKRQRKKKEEHEGKRRERERQRDRERERRRECRLPCVVCSSDAATPCKSLP